MELKSNKTSGKLKDIIPENTINEIGNQIEKFLLDKKESSRISQKYYLVKDNLDRITYLNEVKEVVDISILKKFFNQILSAIILKPEKYTLATSEMHIRWPDCEQIPPHQDNFYHCFQEVSSFKILIPITKYLMPNSFLNYAIVSTKQKTLNHIASATPAFSSYIPEIIISKMNLQWINYKFNLGDILWHSINSIHYAEKNLTFNKSIFLVFRFDHIDSKIDFKMSKKYNLVFTEHKKLTNITY
tara:strand:- start:98 stop:829 length:732 start_codon:yes stop_codon:yes gene_type:complete